MRLGYFGGSFDPPHLGHLAMAGAVARAFSLDRVLFAPTGRQPLKPAGSVATFPDRLAMTELLCRAQQGADFEATAIDAPLADGEPNYTVDALALLHRQAPADEIFALVGADAFLDLRLWRDPDRLLELAEWIVVSRPGFALEQIDALNLTAAQRLRIHCLLYTSVPGAGSVVEKSPAKFAAVGTWDCVVAVADLLSRNWYPAKKKSLSLPLNSLGILTGPPNVPPYSFWCSLSLVVVPGTGTTPKFVASIKLLRMNSKAAPWYVFVPERVTTLTLSLIHI